MILVSLVAGVAGVGRGRAAEGGGPRIEGVAIGFDGVFKVGHWTPIWVEVSGKAQGPVSLELVTPDTDGVLTCFAEPASTFELPASGTTTVLRYFKPGRLSGDLEVRIVNRERELASRRFAPGQFPPALPADHPLVVTFGGSIGVEEALAQSQASNANGAPRLTSPRQLPDRWHGYEGVNVLVLPTSEPALFDAIAADQVEAIRQWVRMGGRVILCVGRRGDVVLGKQSPWRDFAPGNVSGSVPLRSLSALETYSGSSTPLKASVASPLRMARLTDAQGHVELADTAADGLRPMIVRKAYGFGLVTLVTFDLDQPPFSTWDGTYRISGKVLERLLGFSGPRRTEATTTGRVVHEGFRDLVGQLRTAMDEYPGVPLVAFSWVAFLSLFYITLIGPGDYFLLNRLLRRMEWTWITFPAVMLAFGAIAVALALQWKGRELRLNQVDVMDLDAASGVVRGTSWMHVYSPRTEAYDFEVEGSSPAVHVHGRLLSWQGLPGGGLGGMSSQTRASTFERPYTVASTSPTATRLDRVPIAVSASKSFLGRWWGAAEIQSKVSLQETADGLLKGVVSNPLPVELFDASVFYKNWMYRLDRTDGKLSSGQSTPLDLEHPYNLEWRLMRRRVKDVNDVRSPWDPASKDIPRILEMMMFHRAAGATSYTDLDHAYQSFVDLSDHLTAGCAILSARCRTASLRMTINGKEPDRAAQQHWTFVRITLPVRSYDRTRSPEGAE